ncbi:unnamed protein product [Xylocopa violacea]|uniref:MD-2-related lipid-recognition domain-containing protein n=2 Tax=Xylocopa violacea TaxID=135666 RepID=A0ABP1PHE4_XYLVO
MLRIRENRYLPRHCPSSVIIATIVRHVFLQVCNTRKVEPQRNGYSICDRDAKKRVVRVIIYAKFFSLFDTCAFCSPRPKFRESVGTETIAFAGRGQIFFGVFEGRKTIVKRALPRGKRYRACNILGSGSLARQGNRARGRTRGYYQHVRGHNNVAFRGYTLSRTVESRICWILEIGATAGEEDDEQSVISWRETFLRGQRTAFTEMLRGTVLIFVALLAVANATEVNQCGTGETLEDSDRIKISGCDVPPCKLKRRTKATIEQKFVPDRDVQSLVNNVHAIVLGVPLPFVGVDGTSACENVFNADGTTAGCALKKGTEYTYKREFSVLQIYPTISMVIHYALMEGNNTIACFEVPAKITN